MAMMLLLLLVVVVVVAAAVVVMTTYAVRITLHVNLASSRRSR